MSSGPVRLSFSAFGGRLQCAVAQDTLSHKAYLPFDEAHVLAASRELVAVLTRGNRARTLTAQCLHDLRHRGEELYRALIPEAVREELEGAEGREVLLEVDEALVAVPWELLHDGRAFLCRRFDLGRTVSTPQPRRAQGARRMGRPARMLIVCSDPRGDLPAVGQEGHAIATEMDAHPDVMARVVAGKDADFVRKVVKDYDIVHFAGHADYDRADPEASGWHLTGGKLTARDVAALAGGRPMPLLVFSNACASSHEGAWRADDPGRVFGLANAFLLSGVRFYLGTQWEVVDAHSQSFARAFYAELARGRSVGAAVRRAREAVIVAEGEGGLGWASYVLYGDPSYVPLGATDAAKISQPQLPTPADLIARESIRGVVKVRMSKRDDVTSSGSAEVLAPTRGGKITHIHLDTPAEGTPAASASTSGPDLAVRPSDMRRTGPNTVLPEPPARPATGRARTAMWACLAATLVAIGTIIYLLR
jgi:CHAT domain-containing protein